VEEVLEYVEVSDSDLSAVDCVEDLKEYESAEDDGEKLELVLGVKIVLAIFKSFLSFFQTVSRFSAAMLGVLFRGD
jgi:hypothetical protein